MCIRDRVKRYFAQNNITVYYINATKIAQEIGLGNRTNTIFTTGLRGQYNTTGNLGAPRINRIFVDRPESGEQFVFSQPYDCLLYTSERTKTLRKVS